MLQWVSSWSGRSGGSGRSPAPRRAMTAWSAVASKTMASASARIARDRRPIVGELADRRVAGHHAVRGPADRTAVGRALTRALAAPRRIARRAYGSRLGAFRRQREADRGDLADRRRAADDHLADRPGDLGGGLAGDLDELVGEPALVDEDEAIRLEPERGPEAGRDPGARAWPGRRGWPGRAVREDAGRDLRGRVAQGPSRAHDRRRGPRLAGETRKKRRRSRRGPRRARAAGGTSGRRAGRSGSLIGGRTGPGRGRSAGRSVLDDARDSGP